jgi:hypothetical protein
MPMQLCLLLLLLCCLNTYACAAATCSIDRHPHSLPSNLWLCPGVTLGPQQDIAQERGGRARLDLFTGVVMAASGVTHGLLFSHQRHALSAPHLVMPLRVLHQTMSHVM